MYSFHSEWTSEFIHIDLVLPMWQNKKIVIKVSIKNARLAS